MTNEEIEKIDEMIAVLEACKRGEGIEIRPRKYKTHWRSCTWVSVYSGIYG